MVAIRLPSQLTGGDKADAPLFETLLQPGVDAPRRAVVAGKGYNSHAGRAAARACDAGTVIPQEGNAAKHARHLSLTLCRGRARI